MSRTVKLDSKSYGIVGKRKPPRRQTRNKQEARLVAMKEHALQKEKDKYDNSPKGIMKQLRSTLQEAFSNSPVDMVLYTALGAYTYDKMGRNLGAALYGPVCLKLATAQNEASAIVGSAGLVSLGLAPFLLQPLTEGWNALMNNIKISFSASGFTTSDLLEYFPDSYKPHVLEWYAGILNGSISSNIEDDYCNWVTRKYPDEPKPKFCTWTGPMPPPQGTEFP